MDFSRKQYMLDNSKHARTRVKDPEDGIDHNFGGTRVRDDYGTPTWSDRHDKDGCVMRTIKTQDGSIVRVRDKDIVEVKRRTRKSYAMGADISDERWKKIMGRGKKAKST